MTTIVVQRVGGPRQELTLPKDVTVDILRRLIGDAFECSPLSLKLVHKGMTLPDDGSSTLRFANGDVVLAMPQRKAPPAHIVSAAIGARSGSRAGEEEDDEDEADEPARLPQGAPKWEVMLVEWIRRRNCNPLAMEWVILIRPMRIAALLVFIAGCLIASRIGLGPVFILATIVYVIFTNLGSKREGDVSAYSIFNAGVQRLPGQLDADQNRPADAERPAMMLEPS